MIVELHSALVQFEDAVPRLDASSFASSATLALALEQGGYASQPAALLARLDKALGAPLRKAP